MTPRQYGLDVLHLPVPPGFETACGYFGPARFVSFRWSFAEDQLICDDNATESFGYWESYILYLQHPRVEKLLWAFDLGSSLKEARHSLVLDRLFRTLYVGHRSDVQRFLEAVQPKAEPGRTDMRSSQPAHPARPGRSRAGPDRHFKERWEQLQSIRRWIAANLG